MEPTATLRHEHELVCRAIAGADALAARARASAEIDARAARAFIAFSRGFTDGCHHLKEERHLFPLLADRDPAARRGPVAAMLREHEAGRERIRRLEVALESVEAGNGAAVEAAAENLSAYAALLRSHIAKENNVLFPLAERLLSEDERRKVAAAFERIEEEETGAGEHQRFEAIAEELGGTASCAE